MFCPKCGKQINDNAVVCNYCGYRVANSTAAKTGGKNWIAAYLLSWFLGMFGAHRFYLGQTGSAVAQLCTLGGCGVWALIDFVRLSFNKYKDAEGKDLSDYNKALGMVGFGLLIAGVIIYAIMILTAPALLLMS